METEAQPKKKAWQQESKVPARKVQVATAAAAVVTIFTWALDEFAAFEVPPEISVAVVTLLVFAAGYFTPPAEKDKIEPKQ